ncbi:MAG: hypothetical protein KGO01_05360, partial [Burkholderiales bacterium]|nr:hypothetical protein [Burkholderiales bacterium]
APTLVKDAAAVLPLTLARHRRVALLTDPLRRGMPSVELQPLIVAELLREEGFEVAEWPVDGRLPQGDEADVVIYLMAQESLMAQSSIGLDWTRVHGAVHAAMRRGWHEIPTLLISFGHPYYLFDAPRMPCVVNAYTAIEPVQRAVVRKLLGREPFTGVSPVDPFCGLPDARY